MPPLETLKDYLNKEQQIYRITTAAYFDAIKDQFNAAGQSTIAKMVPKINQGVKPKAQFRRTISPEDLDVCKGSALYPYSHYQNLEKTTPDMIYGKIVKNLVAMIESSKATEDLKEKAYIKFKTLAQASVAADGTVTPLNSSMSLSDLEKMIKKEDDIKLYNQFYNKSYVYANNYDNKDVMPENLRYPNVALTDDYLDEAFKPLIDEYNTVIHGAGTAGISVWWTPVLGWGGNLIANYFLKDGINDNELEKAFKLYVKQSFASEYVNANNSYNLCLENQGDPYAIVSTKANEILSTRNNATLPGNADSCGCDEYGGGGISFSFVKSIRGSLCSVLCTLAVFAQNQLTKAIKTLENVVGVTSY
jgi:hypothetical protein